MDIRDISAEYSEEELYNAYKHTTYWKLLVLKVRLYELYSVLPSHIQQSIRGIYSILYRREFKYPQELVDIINKWET